MQKKATLEIKSRSAAAGEYRDIPNGGGFCKMYTLRYRVKATFAEQLER
jgi:hypothetical protein